MDKKTKNIIAIILIVILVVGLAFTIRGKDRNKEQLANMNMQGAINNREMARQNERFEIQEQHKMVEKQAQESKTSETTIDEENKEETTSSDYQEMLRPKKEDRNAQRQNPMANNKVQKDDTLRAVLIAVEAFLLGGTVMFLIFNNRNKEENDLENKTRRIK